MPSSLHYTTLTKHFGVGEMSEVKLYLNKSLIFHASLTRFAKTRCPRNKSGDAH